PLHPHGTDGLAGHSSHRGLARNASRICATRFWPTTSPRPKRWCPSWTKHIGAVRTHIKGQGPAWRTVLQTRPSEDDGLKNRPTPDPLIRARSEERRVGKECRAGWSSD